MSGDHNCIRFIILLLLFVFSMSILVLSPSLLILIFGWDGLGITSFLLVIYYNNSSSLRSGLVTIYVNRLGDIFLVFSFFLILSVSCSTKELMYSHFDFLLFLLLILAGITKRAQLPFCSWLPAAIAAPTPISSLVHSSTLVTAGVYIFIRFFFLFDGLFFSKVFLFLFLSTSFVAGVFACFEVDLKKLVAMSTLSQLGLIIVSLGLGNLLYSFFHMLRHALFKSLLFLRCGFMIILAQGSQDIRFRGCKFLSRYSISLIICLSSIRLCGFPFFSGFFSKDLIIESFFLMDFFLLRFFLFCVSCILSIVYSYKLVMLRLYGDTLSFPSLMGFFSIFNFFMLSFLFVWAIILGKVFSFLFLEGELSLYCFFNRILGVVFFFMSVLFLFGRLSRSFFSEMLWLNWVFGYIFSRAQVSLTRLTIVGESYWLELLGPRGLVFFIYSYCLSILRYGALKFILFFFIFCFIVFLLLPYSLF